MAGNVDKVRSVVLAGHGGAGKTTLVEAILHSAGAIGRAGTVEQGNTVCDSDDLEKERKHSIDSAVVEFEHKGTFFSIIDTPGYPDFIGPAIAGLAGGDIAVIVVSATSGVEVNTRKMFNVANEMGMPRAIVINKIDHENIELETLVSTLQETFGKSVIPLNLPADKGKKVVNCITGGDGTLDFGDLDLAKVALTEGVVESDEKLMERYLGGEEIASAELAVAFKKAFAAGAIVPILFTSASHNVGVTEFMDFVVNVAPTPLDVAQRKLLVGEGDAISEKPVVPDPAGPLVGLVFKVYSDPKSHIKYSAVRMLCGTIKADTAFHIGHEKKPIRAGHIYRMKGAELIDVPQAEPGHICALARIEELKIGDVIHLGNESCKLPIGPFPVPMFAQAVEPKSRGDETKISGALHRLAEEDPCFRTDRDRQTAELVVYGTSDLHLRLVLEKMVRRFKVEVNVHPPKIPYHETISMAAEGHYRHKKQTGGAGQFGEVYLKVEPMERNTGFEFVNDIFGGSIPGQFLPAIEKGVHDLMDQGAVAGFPMQDIRVRVYDGKHHPVDSKEVAFRIAGKLAMKEAIQKAKPVLLEPVVHIEVTVPAQFVGDITGDLSGRRGRISGQDVLPGGMAVIKAQVPLSEVMQYNSQLRSVTGGQGSYSMELSHYDPVPPNVQQDIVKQYQPKKDVDEE